MSAAGGWPEPPTPLKGKFCHCQGIEILNLVHCVLSLSLSLPVFLSRCYPGPQSVVCLHNLVLLDRGEPGPGVGPARARNALKRKEDIHIPKVSFPILHALNRR